MPKILVIDSARFHHEIAKALQKIYGEGTKVFYKIHPFVPRIYSLENISIPTNEKFDLFFVSGLYLSQEKIEPLLLKEQHGTKHSKIVALSSDAALLEELEAASFPGIDYYMFKQPLSMYAETNQLSDEIQKKLLSYLPK